MILTTTKQLFREAKKCFGSELLNFNIIMKQMKKIKLTMYSQEYLGKTIHDHLSINILIDICFIHANIMATIEERTICDFWPNNNTNIWMRFTLILPCISALVRRNSIQITSDYFNGDIRSGPTRGFGCVIRYLGLVD